MQHLFDAYVQGGSDDSFRYLPEDWEGTETAAFQAAALTHPPNSDFAKVVQKIRNIRPTVPQKGHWY